MATGYERGDVIDDQFEVIDVAGSGGFATVYRVVNQVDDREYAIKLLGRGASIDHVRREYAPLRRLDHPNVVRAHWAARTSDGTWYLATDYIDGENARTLINRSAPLEPTLFFTLGDQLFAALRALHGDDRRRSELENRTERTYEEHQELEDLRAAATVHRDIKPENLVIKPTGDLVLVDFGIATTPGAEIRTRTATPEYLPPDLSASLHWNPDIDRYAVAVVLHEMAYGCPPGDESPELQGFDSGLAEFLDRACQAGREARFASTNDMFEAWSAIPREHPVAHGHVAAEASGAEFVGWTPRALPPVDSMTHDELTEILEEIVAAEGPVLCRRAYDLIELAAGTRPTSLLNVVTHRAVQAGRVEQVERTGGGQQNKTIHTVGSNPFVRRTLGDRDPSELPACEIEAWFRWTNDVFPEQHGDVAAAADRIAWFVAGDRPDDTIAKLRYRIERELPAIETPVPYYVYENWTNTFAKVHKADCPYCNDGQGFQGRGASTPSGQWLGPFSDGDSALLAARAAADEHGNSAVWVVDRCGYCGGPSR